MSFNKPLGPAGQFAKTDSRYFAVNDARNGYRNETLVNRFYKSYGGTSRFDVDLPKPAMMDELSTMLKVTGYVESHNGQTGLNFKAFSGNNAVGISNLDGLLASQVSIWPRKGWYGGTSDVWLNWHVFDWKVGTQSTGYFEVVIQKLSSNWCVMSWNMQGAKQDGVGWRTRGKGTLSHEFKDITKLLFSAETNVSTAFVEVEIY